MAHLNRRRFLKTSLATAGAPFFISGTKSSGQVVGANERINCGVAGFHGQGNSHVGALSARKDTRVIYLIDPDSRLFPSRVKTVEERGGNTPKTVQDIRRALEDKDLDAISIAAPNHWHALLTIWACQAGKHVYVEKPCSHNVHEGRIAVETARKHNRMVQHGTQNRSSAGWARVAELVKKGTYGKLLVSYGLCYKSRGSIGFKEPKEPPAELDFNIWLGPAPQQPYHENLVHYNWHWFWDTGNGDIGNQGVHEIDKARWALGGATLPKSVISCGGRFGYKDQGQTANTQVAIFDYGETMLIFEVRGLKTDGFHGQKVGNVCVFEEGILAGNNRFYRQGSKESEPVAQVEVQMGPGGNPWGNWVAAMQSGKHTDLNADILEAHYSSALFHLANISLRLGKEVPFDQKTGTFAENKAASDAFERMKDHLKDNAVQLADTKYFLGRFLKFDAATEKFVGDEEANKMLTRNYRAPFVVPDKVV